MRLLFSMDSVSRVELDRNTSGRVPVRKLLSAGGAHAYQSSLKAGDHACIPLILYWGVPSFVQQVSLQNMADCTSVHKLPQHVNW